MIKHLGYLMLVFIGGCQSSGMNHLPETDYQGEVPQALNNELIKLNSAPTQSLRGESIHTVYEEDKALLTIIRKLRNNRWEWNLEKSKVTEDVSQNLCRDFGDAIDLGLGVRVWFAGNGGFVTDVIKAGDCNGLK